jgi:hypothetical protein
VENPQATSREVSGIERRYVKSLSDIELAGAMECERHTCQPERGPMSRRALTIGPKSIVARTVISKLQSQMLPLLTH